MAPRRAPGRKGGSVDYPADCAYKGCVELVVRFKVDSQEKWEQGDPCSCHRFKEQSSWTSSPPLPLANMTIVRSLIAFTLVVALALCREDTWEESTAVESSATKTVSKCPFLPSSEARFSNLCTDKIDSNSCFQGVCQTASLSET